MYRWFTRIALCLLLLGLPAGPARGDGFSAHTDRAIALYQAQRYEEAIQEFLAAYAVRQWPRLLFNIGQAHLKLGHAREALRYYEQYLRLRPEPEPAVKADLERAMAEAHALLDAPQEARSEEPPREAAPEPPPPAPPSPAPAPAPAAAVAPSAVNPAPPPRKPLVRRWWFWTSLALAAGAAAVTAGVLSTQPWQSPAWRAVPDADRRGVSF